MVLDECHGILPERGIVHEVVGAVEQCPVAAIGSVAHIVPELEVEGSAVLARVLYPGLDIGVAVPVFAHGELYSRRLVVVCHVGCREALHHIISEARVSEVILEVPDISLDDVLHVLALVVEVAHASPVLALVVVGTERNALPGSLLGSLAAVVVGRDVSRQQLVGHPLVGLGREGEPSRGVVMVYHHVGHGTYSCSLERRYEVAQLALRAEARVLVEVIVWRVAHGLVSLQTLAALRNPY